MRSRPLAARGRRKTSPRRASRCEAERTEPFVCPLWRKPRSGIERGQARTGVSVVGVSQDAFTSGGRKASAGCAGIASVSQSHRAPSKGGARRVRSDAIVRWNTPPIDARCPLFTKRAEAAISAARATTLRVQHTRRGASFGRRRDVRRVGLSAARREDNARVRGWWIACLAMDIPTIAPTLKRMGRREARHSSARGSSRGVARLDVRRHAERVADAARRPRLQVVNRSIRSPVERFGCPFRRYRWQTPVACTLVVWLGARKRFERRRDLKRGVESVRDGLEVRGLVAKRRSSCSMHGGRRMRRVRDEGVLRVPMFVVSQPRSGIHDAELVSTSCDTVKGVPVWKP